MLPIVAVGVLAGVAVAVMPELAVPIGVGVTVVSLLVAMIRP
ncbi:hypothetical protein [Actinomadura decatromicini]|nr:hypothetical protein [Actinomadura decatromicini]